MTKLTTDTTIHAKVRSKICTGHRSWIKQGRRLPCPRFSCCWTRWWVGDGISRRSFTCAHFRNEGHLKVRFLSFINWNCLAAVAQPRHYWCSFRRLVAGEGLTMDDILSVFAMFEWRNELVKCGMLHAQQVKRHILQIKISKAWSPVPHFIPFQDSTL